MARQCPVCGKLKLYLDCLECEDKYLCDATKKEEIGKKYEENKNMRAWLKLLIVDGLSIPATAYIKSDKEIM